MSSVIPMTIGHYTCPNCGVQLILALEQSFRKQI